MMPMTAPKDFSGLPSGSYASSWMNTLRERLIFVRFPGAEIGQLWHDDVGPESLDVTPLKDEDIDQWVKNVLAARGLNPTPARVRTLHSFAPKAVAENVVLDEDEQEWLNLCWITSQPGVEVQQRRQA